MKNQITDFDEVAFIRREGLNEVIRLTEQRFIEFAEFRKNLLVSVERARIRAAKEGKS